eukprot:CAMPEP_0184079314 /NCGR_PEP_ID=MMETSP0974-20121125/1614_1 /TAXON_ID=483370 /ORGANISM="non described non described, Strain CCMP2097" /LENGTH=284 /DNA_ID=CAMNT_0026381929 /DNA_START=117 /DNA_END=968 /DNA_ORIENTATION=+
MPGVVRVSPLPMHERILADGSVVMPVGTIGKYHAKLIDTSKGALCRENSARHAHLQSMRVPLQSAPSAPPSEPPAPSSKVSMAVLPGMLRYAHDRSDGRPQITVERYLGEYDTALRAVAGRAFAHDYESASVASGGADDDPRRLREEERLDLYGPEVPEVILSATEARAAPTSAVGMQQKQINLMALAAEEAVPKPDGLAWLQTKSLKLLEREGHGLDVEEQFIHDRLYLSWIDQRQVAFLRTKRNLERERKEARINRARAAYEDDVEKKGQKFSGMVPKQVRE